MRRQTKNRANRPFEHAVVIGGGIAGLAAAQVLSDYFRRVTVVERDSRPDQAEFRPGTPQARHAHTLMPQAETALEKRFPGLSADLLAQGAVPVNDSGGIIFHEKGDWHTFQPNLPHPSVSASRPLLEHALYQRLAARPGIHFLTGYQVSGLQSDKNARRVTGVRLHGLETDANLSELEADLVLDAGGRNSHAPDWLTGLGLEPPEEWRINAYVGYVSRMYEIPAGYQEKWAKMYVKATAPQETRGAVALAVEGQRWHVTLYGMMRDYPPADEDGFLEFARSLPAPELYQALRDARPLSRPAGFRDTENRIRRYDSLPRHLEGFLVAGDAAYALNPIYAHGMTAAIFAGDALEKSLATYAGSGRSDLNGLARSFQQTLSKVVARLWKMSTTRDWHWPATEIDDNESPLPRRRNRGRNQTALATL